MNGQTNGQRRLMVVQLPVFPIVRESLLMPFWCLPELVKFGWIPFAAVLAVDLVCYGLEREDVSGGVTSGLMVISHFLLFTPFSVAWTKLAIKGRGAVANHPQFSYSRTQWLYLGAVAVMMTALVILVGIPYVLLRYGQRNFDSQITLLGGAATMLGLGIYMIGYVRLAFVFPAIAIGKYAGIRSAWRQTAGNIERLAAVLVLAFLPYWIVRQAFEWWMGYHPPGAIEAFRGCIDMLLLALAITALAAPALAYKATLESRTDEFAAESSGAGG